MASQLRYICKPAELHMQASCATCASQLRYVCNPHREDLDGVCEKLENAGDDVCLHFTSKTGQLTLGPPCRKRVSAVLQWLSVVTCVSPCQALPTIRPAGMGKRLDLIQGGKQRL